MDLPLNLWTVDAVLQHWAEREVYLTTDEIETAAVRLGRNSYPDLIASLWAEGHLTVEVAARVVPAAWSSCEHPQEALGEEEWRDLFDLAGYTVEGVPAPRPDVPVRVYRGTDAAHRLGWSWTDNRALAAWFAGRWPGGAVWTLLAPPDRLLARISESRPGESEYVVDTTGLDVTAVERS